MYFNILYNDQDSSDSDEQPRNTVFNEDEPAIVIEEDIKLELSDDEVEIVGVQTTLDDVYVTAESDDDMKVNKIKGQNAIDPLAIDKPKGREIPVNRTPLNVREEKIVVHGTPGSNVRHDPLHVTMDMPLCSDVLERVEAMDLSEEEAEELLEAAPWHVRRWNMDSGVEEQKCSPNPLKPSAAAEDDRGCAALNGVRARQGVTKVPSAGANVNVIPDVDMRPSTSGVTAKFKPGYRREIDEGSDLDSEFDDEFDSIPIENTAWMRFEKEIPDNDELEDPIRNVITNIERAMDDEADRLPGVSSSFNWVAGYETFRGVPEQFSGPTPGPVNDYDSPYDAFIDIWDKDIIERIALETNRYAMQTIDALKDKGELKPSSRLHDWTDTNADEILLLFGVFMYMSINPRPSLIEYWKSGDYLELTRFKHLITYNRYTLLNKFLHFIDNSDTNLNLQSEEITPAKGFSRKLFKLSPIIEHLGNKFSSLYHLGRNIAIDESLTLFKGQLSWVQTIRRKATRLGIRSYELCESRTGYMARFQIYTGESNAVNSDPSTNVDLGVRSIEAVLKLLQGLEHRGHCVTMDNFYNSPSLARYLKVQGFDCLGALRTTRRNVPKDTANVPKNVPKGTIISRQCGDLSIVTWKDYKLVNIISSYSDNGSFVGSRPVKMLERPECVRNYNSIMEAIDVKHRKLSMYLLERKRGVKWYMKMFKRLLNASIYNAFIMYVSSLTRRHKLSVTQRQFRYELAKALVDRHRPCPEIGEPVGDVMRLRRDIVHVPKYTSGRSNRKRCIVCQCLKIQKKVHSLCATCDVFLCFENCWKTWHSSTDFGTPLTRRRKRKRDE